MKHEILLEVGDFLSRIPKELLHDGPHDTESKLKFDVAELADRIGRGETTIRLAEIHRCAPEIFRGEIFASDKRAVRFPWQKVAQLLAAARTMPSLGSRTEGLTHAGAEFLAERLRLYRTASNIIPGMAETGGIPHLVHALPPALKVGSTAGGSPTAGTPASPQRPAQAAPGMPKILPEGALTLAANTTGAAPNAPRSDDEKRSREELLRSRDALRAQLARTKSEFARQLSVAWEERQRIGVERERFIAEMMRANAVAAERGEQMAFEKSVAAKCAENLIKAQEEAGVFQRELSALQVEMVKTHEETDVFIEELVAERNTLAKGRPLASHQIAELQKRRNLLQAMRAEAARMVDALRSAREARRQIDASKPPIGTAGSPQLGTAHVEAPPVAKRRGFARALRSIFATLTFLAILAGALATWYLQISERDEVVSAEVRQLDREWATVSASLNEVRSARSQLQRFIQGARSARAELEGGDRWTPVLRSIVASTNAGLELRKLKVVKKSDNSPVEGLRIEGSAVGDEPRAIADQFLLTLQRELRQHFPLAEPCRFGRLEAAPEQASDEPDERRTLFTIYAPITAAIPGTGEPHPKP